MPKPTDGTDPKDLKVIKQVLEATRNQVNSSLELLDEPLRGMFTNIKGQFDTMLAQLPPTEQVRGALDLGWELQSLHSCFQSLNSMFEMLNQSLSAARKDAANMPAKIADAIKAKVDAGELIAKDAVAGLIATEVTKKITAGELVAKEVHTQLCSEAKNLGLTEGEAKLRKEQADAAAAATLIAERKTALQTAGLPLPEGAVESVLGAADDVFTAARTEVATRVKDLQKIGVANNSPLLAKAWLPKEQYDTVHATTRETLATLKTGGEPFAKPGEVVSASGPGGKFFV